MNRLLSVILITVSLILFFSGCEKVTEVSKVKTGGPEVVLFRALQFPLTDVKLLDGPFSHATELNIKTLLTYEPDRLLARFYSEAGLKPNAEQKRS